MKKLLTSIISTFITLTLVSCGTSEKPPEPDLSWNTTPVDKTETPPESEAESSEDSSKVAEILSKRKTTSFGRRLFGDNLAVECGGNVYVLYGNLMLLNSETGCLKPLCADPLCSHNSTSCPNTKTINSMVSDGEKIYCKGSGQLGSAFSAKGGEDESTFVASYDPDTGKFEYLSTWAKERGSVSYALSIHDGLLYYLRRTSDTDNSLYCVPLDGGSAKRINQEDEFINQFSVTDDLIYYTTSAYVLKSMNKDGSGVQVVDEKICMVSADGEDFIAASSVDNDGFALVRNGTPFESPVDSPIDTVISDGCMWYTVRKKMNFGTYTDENGNLRSITSENGTSLYKYDFAAGERTEYDCSFGYGVSRFYGMIDSYMLLGVKNEDKLIEIWLVNAENTDEHYKIYEK